MRRTLASIVRPSSLALLFPLLAAACGGGGAPPVLSALSLGSTTVVRGQTANGMVTVADPDGLGGLRLRVRISGPATSTIENAVQGASSALISADVPFSVLISGAAPAGTYTLGVTAVDGTGNTSAELKTTFEAR